MLPFWPNEPVPSPRPPPSKTEPPVVFPVYDGHTEGSLDSLLSFAEGLVWAIDSDHKNDFRSCPPVVEQGKPCPEVRRSGVEQAGKPIHTKRHWAKDIHAKNMPTYRRQMIPRHHTSLHISRCSRALCGNIHERPMAFISFLVTSQRSRGQWPLGHPPGNLSFRA